LDDTDTLTNNKSEGTMETLKEREHKTEQSTEQSTEQRKTLTTKTDYQTKYQTQYDYVFDLNPGEDITLGEDVLLGYVGLNNNTRQARFRIQAPIEISILRLEVFARHMQTYEYVVDVNYGQKLKIADDISLLAIPDKHGRKLVHLGVETPRDTEVKKSLKNGTD